MELGFCNYFRLAVSGLEYKLIISLLVLVHKRSVLITIFLRVVHRCCLKLWEEGHTELTLPLTTLASCRVPVLVQVSSAMFPLSTPVPVYVCDCLRLPASVSFCHRLSSLLVRVHVCVFVHPSILSLYHCLAHPSTLSVSLLVSVCLSLYMGRWVEHLIYQAAVCWTCTLHILK